MDLIYTDKDRKDVGVLQDYTFDLAFGSDENDFELTLDINNHCCEAGCLLYIENTEYGGIIDGVDVTTRDDKLIYFGRTWHGIFANKIIEPNEREPFYMTVSGEANTIIGQLIDTLGLDGLFVASTSDSGINLTNYAFPRYIDGYSGIKKMLESVSAKLHFAYTNGNVVVSAIPVVDYSTQMQFDNDTVEMEVRKTSNTVNHLICLGKGELGDRMVMHLYVDPSGNITNVQHFFGMQEQTKVYDYPNVESEAELAVSGTEKLLEYAMTDHAVLDLTSDEDIYNIGDIIGAREINTGVVTTAKVSKKIVTINKDGITIQYKVGE